jgi:2-polyprenyl-6-hydroxyphenyl methylase/3-demethylubiquinone-9 3-methyltransferase
MIESIGFSFGRNWQSFLKCADDEAFRVAQKDIEVWLGTETVIDKTILDIGCGSGIHSYGFYSMNARRIISIDVDPLSVEATRTLWKKAGSPGHWTICSGSILDKEFLLRLGYGSFDVVYSWGVLHHTGAMWDALENTSRMVAPGGQLWIALYAKGPKYPDHLKLKQNYNNTSWMGKKLMAWRWIYRLMRQRYREGKNPFAWNERRVRGMNTYHDLLDWLGGLPYDVAAPEEIDKFLLPKAFDLSKSVMGCEGDNHVFLYRRRPIG